MLKRDLVGRCFKGAMIEEVIEVLRLSEINISCEANRSEGKVDVEFRALVTVYYVGEAIVGATITHKEKGLIFAETAKCKIFMNYHKSLETVNEGQQICVRVGATQYSLYSPQVSINAYPMLPIAKPTVYHVSPVNAQSPLVVGAISRLEATKSQLKSARAANPKSYEFFENLLYSYKTPKPRPDGAEEISVSKISESRGYAVRGSQITASSDTVYLYSTPPSVDVSIADPVASAVSLIEETTQSLRVLAEMTVSYDSSRITGHRNYWLTLIKSKLDAN